VPPSPNNRTLSRTERGHQVMSRKTHATTFARLTPVCCCPNLQLTGVKSPYFGDRHVGFETDAKWHNSL
jgi:hypothetical protein